MKEKMNKDKDKDKIDVFVDLDDTQCDFTNAYNESIKKRPQQAYPQAEFDFFRKLKPIDGSIAAMHKLNKSDKYNVFILTRPSLLNPMCYLEKRMWVEDHLGIEFCEKLMIVPDKSKVSKGILIDDTICENFPGEQIVFGTKEYPTWKEVLEYLKP